MSSKKSEARVAGSGPAAQSTDGNGEGARRPVSIRFVDIGKQRLRVAVWPGRRGGVPLLLFNGIGASLEMLMPLADNLGDIETITFDLPGVGESPAPLLPYRLCSMARLASRLLDVLGVDRVDVLGVSWGGTLAQQFALQHPKRCRRLVLAATAQGILMVPGRPSVLRHFFTPRRHNDPEHRRRIGGLIYGGQARSDPAFIQSFEQYVKPASRYAYLLQQLAIAGWTSLPWLPLLRQPVLIMAGKDDPVIPPINARLMATLIPKSRLHLFDDGHLFILSQAAETARVLREFLCADDSRARARVSTSKVAASGRT
ncbi:poly(3-hydroxyalkanoate) depolymerase [Variovorax humicola]|uniref:Poly(3-hydroxyalkanoate) depolymerase n=1 Tax=Variovorax humicola TaxID=1769758 RepID=A0ABU8W7I3_9BURK